MLSKIIKFSIHNKLVIGLFTLALIAWGIYSLKQLPIDAVPDITNNQVQVITLSPSLATQEVERLITFPVEQTMSTIPEIEQVRSISRFGLSVVTIVFHDKVDIYWARQQVNEKLSEAKNNIPPGIGNPEISPISTGLGEIYQYVIHAKPGFEKKYDARELRSIQDWIVRRQLLGTPGIAEVNSFGGLLKQYEIAMDPDKLNSYNLSISDVFKALEKNNQNTGGAYIDKKPNAYFIRSEGLVGNIEDINKIVVKNTSTGIPVLVRDIATVQIGNAIRYGALTRATAQSQGEAVGGIVMMLKGSNANNVVKQVKEKIARINKTLPDGIVVEPFLDRSALVDRAIGTVAKNLIEGALIVIFVLVLFLGNFRAGIVVASVIPLAMLFAISLMNVFGVSGNLMSLGAIDFGLIVDGAVIIVEATMHLLGERKLKQAMTQKEMDAQVEQSATRMMSAAAFGQIIILIVYLPILALVGIEGKMFGPMAQTVSFAILGAFLLSLTYVPMMSSLLLSKKSVTKKNFSDRMMDFFQRYYTPLINGALRKRMLVVTLSAVLLLISVVIFTRMGGEFIPTLEEGDFAVETRLLTGSSLSQSIDKVNQASQILLKEFPEVIEVVGKVGAAEIPTDPMPMEATDLTITLKNKKEWVSATSREELAEKMARALDKVTGVTFGFSQPIQLRSNELISGVRQDIGIKLFGDDLETLTDISQKIGKIVNTVDGAKDLYLEQATGLPQIVVKINRDQLARYGIDIETVNQAINSAFAGQSAGLVYEGERRYDMVVRLSEQNRQGIDDVKNIYISAPNGSKIPLTQLAAIAFQIGPNQIQREDTKRRIIVGLNVRGRDIATVVNEIEQKINEKIKLPAGYYITYGGQFENLKAAKERLSIAVPVALLLILLLLYFSFGSVKQSVLIFSAIPMAAIGGVFALLLRGMPFSISAGVGFIALFGVAVLNGIVLITEFNRLKASGITDLREIVLKGTALRLRPVLMTATVASLGFLPMALSTAAGAEVQKPLATVVIGGLLTSTILTLLVLPLFLVFQVNRYFNLKPVLKAYILGCLLSCIIIVGYFYLYRFNIFTESVQCVFPKGVQGHTLTEDIILFQGFTTEYFKHRAAIGVNLSLSIACLIYLVKQSHGISNREKTGSILVGLVFILVLYASGSRSGYISLFVVLIFGLIYLFSKRKKILSIAFLCTISLLIGLSSLKTTRPLLFNEISTFNYDKIRNMDPRFQIWESCIDIIRQNPVIGVGYSHVKPELLQKYKEKGLELNLNEKFNSHNQFFQFALESGIWTSIIFAFIFLPSYFRKKTLYLSMAFSVTFIVYSMFEDSFLLINGISIFIFFITTLTLSQKSTPENID